ncbi:3-isopropylmalate dehydrogenase [Bradyrhizobium macuxiense]|uniref:3-isopropylmalate dehydrogenase n=1 Tax=Bradyrhizobium macuxiense TaxID=1755647 RepID=A0A560KX71_9BRAD|nr:3-isopropylmalate dehydrogenase [Bradyrhizobium macuxiense]TWB87737.1 3-isopropylmalate dehydrogenase [Bradyrhizobium macuxiense]
MTPSDNRSVAIVGGDGIGPEVTAEGRRVLALVAEKRSLPMKLVDGDYGVEAYEKRGRMWPEPTRVAMAEADAVLFGAIGGPAQPLPPEMHRTDSLLAVRRSLDVFVNLRPIKTAPALYEASSLKPRVLKGVDLIIVRELLGGIYFGEPRGVETLPGGERRGVNTHIYTSSQIQRIARFAFDIARTRKGRVCSVAKENVMEAGQLWREEVQAVHDNQYPDVELTHMLVDNCAMQLVRAPAQFDVLLTDNLFGDILSDSAAMVTGSLGMLPSASLGAVRADGRRGALYEPVHGSAPDIAGKGLANPIGSILSVAMMLRFSLGMPEEADLVERAVSDALEAGARTIDIAVGRTYVSTREMGDAVASELTSLLN